LADDQAGQWRHHVRCQPGSRQAAVPGQLRPATRSLEEECRQRMRATRSSGPLDHRCGGELRCHRDHAGVRDDRGRAKQPPWRRLRRWRAAMRQPPRTGRSRKARPVHERSPLLRETRASAGYRIVPAVCEYPVQSSIASITSLRPFPTSSWQLRTVFDSHSQESFALWVKNRRSHLALPCKHGPESREGHSEKDAAKSSHDGEVGPNHSHSGAAIKDCLAESDEVCRRRDVHRIL